METQPPSPSTEDDRRHEDPQVVEADPGWPTPDDFDDVRLITVEDAAERLSICRTKLYELIARGELPTIKIGRSRRVWMEDLRTFVAQRRTA